MPDKSTAIPARGTGVVETVVAPPAGVELPAGVVRIVVRRSARRRRTVAARREGASIVVLLPARMNRVEQDHWVSTMVAKIARRASRGRTLAGDDELERRATELSQRYLAGRAAPRSVRWVGNQNGRWGSCTPAQGTIRLSDRMKPMPAWVIDYVLLHELVHLLHPDHSPAFHALLSRYDKAERAQGFLEGWTAGRELGPENDQVD